MINNEKKMFSMTDSISLSNFERGAKEGLNRFIILSATLDTIEVKNSEEKQVLVLQIELTNEKYREYKITLDKYYVFIDFSPKSQFCTLISSVLKTLDKSELSSIGELIGKRGTVNLSYYRPDENRCYERLSNWMFFEERNKVDAMLSEYAEELLSFELEEKN